MHSRGSFDWKVVVTAGFFIAPKTEHLRSWLAASNRSIVTSLRPRAGTFAMRNKLTSSLWIHEHFKIGQKIANFAPIKKALAADQMIAHLAWRRAVSSGRDWILVRNRIAWLPQGMRCVSRAYSICSTMCAPPLRRR